MRHRVPNPETSASLLGARIPTSLRRSPRDPWIESRRRNSFGTGGNLALGSKDWGAQIKTAIVQGLLGPIDVWLSLAAQEVPNSMWDTLARGDLFDDLSPRLAQDPYDFTSVPESVRDYFLTDGGIRTSLPTKANVFHLVQNAEQVRLPAAAATWDELLAEVARLSAEDRDGDGVADPAVCLPDNSPWSTIFFFYSIVSSYMLWAGPQDVLQLELRDMHALLDTSGYEEAARVSAHCEGARGLRVSLVYPL